jgi:hypothetical protein
MVSGYTSQGIYLGGNDYYSFSFSASNYLTIASGVNLN